MDVVKIIIQIGVKNAFEQLLSVTYQNVLECLPIRLVANLVSSDSY